MESVNAIQNLTGQLKRVCDLVEMAQGCEGIGHLWDWYCDTHAIGSMAEMLKDDDTFRYGLEYGVLLATAHLFGIPEQSEGSTDKPNE